MNALVWAGVVLIGGCGSVLRFAVDGVVGARLGRAFPFGTLVVNVSGAMILGGLTGLALPEDGALLAGTAAVGSYTTFSTWMFETQRLTEERQTPLRRTQHRCQPRPGGRRRRRRQVDRHPRMNGDCLKLTVYFGERTRVGHQFVADALLDLYGRHRVATSILIRGVEGFGLKHHLRTDSSLTLSEDLPAVAVAVDTRTRIEALLPEATQLTEHGLVTLERARLQTGDVRPRQPARGARRGHQADRVRRASGAGLPGARLRRGLRPAAPPRHRRRHRTARS